MTPLSGPAPVIVTGCFSPAAMVLGPLLVFADEDLAFRKEGVRWHPEIVGRGLVLVDPPGEIEERPVAGAVEAAFPVAGEGLGPRLQAVLRRAAEVRADADDDEILRLDRAVFVPRILGRELVLLALALGVGDLAIVLLHTIEHLLG